MSWQFELLQWGAIAGLAKLAFDFRAQVWEARRQAALMRHELIQTRLDIKKAEGAAGNAGGLQLQQVREMTMRIFDQVNQTLEARPPDGGA
ncbi:MAG: hypothetical protein CML02_02390 [Pseudooceanicola sp.]|nr:hypothetical protein [Pseudooceanicola sp.]|tara:strand:+ start:69 stop:341 length:273 start_codon:yes stop_codon:yes gene_type:complete